MKIQESTKTLNPVAAVNAVKAKQHTHTLLKMCFNCSSIFLFFLFTHLFYW